MIFLAPTKPLVHQQMEACQQFMGSAKVCLTVATLLSGKVILLYVRSSRLRFL